MVSNFLEHEQFSTIADTTVTSMTTMMLVDRFKEEEYLAVYHLEKVGHYLEVAPAKQIHIEGHLGYAISYMANMGKIYFIMETFRSLHDLEDFHEKYENFKMNFQKCLAEVRAASPARTILPGVPDANIPRQLAPAQDIIVSSIPRVSSMIECKDADEMFPSDETPISGDEIGIKIFICTTALTLNRNTPEMVEDTAANVESDGDWELFCLERGIQPDTTTASDYSSPHPVWRSLRSSMLSLEPISMATIPPSWMSYQWKPSWLCTAAPRIKLYEENYMAYFLPCTMLSEDSPLAILWKPPWLSTCYDVKTDICVTCLNFLCLERPMSDERSTSTTIDSRMTSCTSLDIMKTVILSCLSDLTSPCFMNPTCVRSLASMHMLDFTTLFCLHTFTSLSLFSSSTSLQLTLNTTLVFPCMVLTLDPPWPPNLSNSTVCMLSITRDFSLNTSMPDLFTMMCMLDPWDLGTSRRLFMVTLSCLYMNCFTLSGGMWTPSWPWPCLLARTKSWLPPSLITPWLGVSTRLMACYTMSRETCCFMSISMYSSFSPMDMFTIFLWKPPWHSVFYFETRINSHRSSTNTSVNMSYLAWLVPTGLVDREDVIVWKYLPQVKTVCLNIRILILHFNQERLEVPPWPIDSLDFLLSVLISTMMRSLSMAPSLVRSSTPSAPYLSTSTIASCMLRTQGSCFTMNVDLWTPCMSDFTSTYCSLRITSFKNYTLPVAPMFLLMESMFSSTELSVYHFSSSTVLSMNCTSLFMVETTICLSVSSLSEEQSGRTKLDISLLKPYYSTVRELCCLIIAAASSVIEASLFMFPLHTVLMSRVEYPFSSLVMDIAFFTRIMWKPPWCLQFISNSMAWRLLWSILTSTILPCMSSLALSRSSTSLQLTLRRNSPRSSCIILSQDPPWPSRTQKTNFVWSCYDMTRSVCMMLYSSIWTLWKPITTCLLFLTIMCSKAEPLPPKSLWVDYSSLTITSYKNTPTVAPTLLLMGNMTIKLFVSSELCVLQFSSSTTVLDLDFLGHDVHGVLQAC